MGDDGRGLDMERLGYCPFSNDDFLNSNSVADAPGFLSREAVESAGVGR